jgi:hypothetical protein
MTKQGHERGGLCRATHLLHSCAVQLALSRESFRENKCQRSLCEMGLRRWPLFSILFVRSAFAITTLFTCVRCILKREQTSEVNSADAH